MSGQYSWLKLPSLLLLSVNWKYGIKAEELKEITLAGAFGNYIDIENAQFIGLLPAISGVPIRSIGNGAETGSQLFLLSQDEAKRCETIPTITTHIELATDPNFSHLCMQNTTLWSKWNEVIHRFHDTGLF